MAFSTALTVLAICALSLAQTINVVKPVPNQHIVNGKTINVQVEQNVSRAASPAIIANLYWYLNGVLTDYHDQKFNGQINELSLIIGLTRGQISGPNAGPGEIIYNGPFQQNLNLQIPNDLPDGTNTLTVFHIAETRVRSPSFMQST